MIKWDRVNGSVGNYRTGQWIGVPDDENSGIILEYETDLDSTVIKLDGNLPKGILEYNQPENHRTILRGLVGAYDIYKTYKFVFRAQSLDETEVDDTYCELIVDNTKTFEGEEIGWKTKPSDFPSELESLTQVSFQFELNTDIGNQNFFKVYGELPPGLTLDPNGYLSGTIEIVEEAKEYRFVIRCEVSGEIEDEVKTLTFDSEEFVVNVVPMQGEMVNPIFLNNNKYLANIDYNKYVSINVKAWISPSYPIRYSIVEGELPFGLTLNQYTGIISGVNLEQNEKYFDFRIRATCEATGGSSEKDYQLSTNLQTYIKDIVTPESGTKFGPYRVGEKVYEEIIVENKNFYYTFDSRDVSRVLPKGLSLSYERRQIDTERLQTVMIISGIVEPQREKTERFTLRWFRDIVSRSADYSIEIRIGKESQLSKLYVQLPHEFLQDWIEQYEAFGELSRETASTDISDIVSENIIYNGEVKYVHRQFDKNVLNYNNDVYGLRYLPKIYLRNVFKTSVEHVEDELGTYEYPLSFSLSNIKYKEYYEYDENGENGVLKYYVIYRDVIDNGFGHISKEFNKETEEGTESTKTIELTSPTFDILKEKLDSISDIEDEKLEWEDDEWSPKLILMYLRPDGLGNVLQVINQLNERFVDKKYSSQYICSESYFPNIVKDEVYWFFTYFQQQPTLDWRSGVYNGNTIIQPILEDSELPEVTDYNLITDENTEDYPNFDIITDSNTKDIEGNEIGSVNLKTDVQIVILDPE